MLDPMAAARDTAATLVMTDPLWMHTPAERSSSYFPTWQRVSLALQSWLREQIPAAYFADIMHFEDRRAAYPVIVYRASRLFQGHPRTEFTYDLRDYPWCRNTLNSAWKLSGRHIRNALGEYEQRLFAAGNPQLAHRYSPVWHVDLLDAVQRRTNPYAELLSRESALINAVIDLGTLRTVESINRFTKIANRLLRRMHGQDMRRLAAGLLEEASVALAQKPAGGGHNVVQMRPPQHTDAGSAGSPHLWIAGQEDGNDRNTNRGGQVRNAGVITDISTGRRQPTRQII
jgi:hypothetical protein